MTDNIVEDGTMSLPILHCWYCYCYLLLLLLLPLLLLLLLPLILLLLWLLRLPLLLLLLLYSQTSFYTTQGRMPPKLRCSLTILLVSFRSPPAPPPPSPLPPHEKIDISATPNHL